MDNPTRRLAVWFDRFRKSTDVGPHQQRAIWCLGLALCILLFIAGRPYLGVRHDGLLYAVQALRHLHPQVFADDLFFRFGSQDSFSLFGPLYAALVGVWGLEAANLALVFLSQFLFLAAIGLLAFAILPVGNRLLGLALLILSAGGYGGMAIFHIAEPFVTARPFAEAGTIVALALLVRGQSIASLGLLVVSALVHPLIALPGLLIWWLFVVREDRRVLLGLLVIPMVGILAITGVAPFTHLLVTHDPEWRELLLRQNPHVFLFGWRIFDWAMLATDLGLAWVVRRELDGRLQRLLDAAIAACLAGVTLTVWGADVFSNALLTSLQPWRAQWPLLVLVAMLLPLALVRWIACGAAGWLTAGLLAYALLNRGLMTGFLGLLLGLTLVSVQPRRPLSLGWRVSVTSLVTLLVATLLAWLNAASWTIALDQVSSGQPLTTWASISAYMRRAPIGPMLLCLPIVSLAFWARRSTVSLVGLAAVTALLAAALWDQRSGWARMVEQQADGTHPFVAWVQPDEEVFWVGDPTVPWLLMHRRSYLSGSQLSGQMFNRQTAEEGARRLKVLAVFEYQQQICELMNKLNEKADACHPDVTTLRTACEADPRLRFMVTAAALKGLWLARWTPSTPRDHTEPTYYLYACDRLTRGGGDAHQD